MQAPLGTRISSTEKVLIKPVVEHFDEHADMCAINWFNLKTSWLYQLYGLIASRFVRKVSGKLFFKGNLLKKLAGPDDHQRENLLIVCYPGARSFLNLVDFKIFQVISILRLTAVRKFCFGFTENILEQAISKGASDPRFSKEQTYLVHHFRGGSDWLRNNRQQLFTAAREHQLDIYFCGLTNAHIVREKSGEQQSPEFFMDGILLYAMRSEAGLESFTQGEINSSFMDSNTSNSLYLFSRSL